VTAGWPFNDVSRHTIPSLDMSTFLESVVAGIVANSIFTLTLIWGIQRCRYWYCLTRKFHDKKFETFYKMFPSVVVQNVTCKVSGNRISYSGHRTTGDGQFEGEFIMSPINLRMGEGFHSHSDSEGFGFSRIIIKGYDFYVETPYTDVKANSSGNKEGIRHYQAFIWRIKSE